MSDIIYLTDVSTITCVVDKGRSDAVLLAARFETRPGSSGEVRAAMQRAMSVRRETQPIDQLSCGSVFVNPPQAYAGRLIEAAGLKAAREGGAEISALHANFIVNRGGATAKDVLTLIARARGREGPGAASRRSASGKGARPSRSRS